MQSFVGRIQAIDRVEVRARVTGYLEAVLFKEGELVKKGAPLYRIEQDPFGAKVQLSQGELFKARAVLQNATVQRQRAEELARTQAGTQATLDQRRADESSAQADVMTADANLRTATINLGYTEIASPIDGRAGRTSVTPGNVVSPDSGVLTLIVSQDPIYVVFPVSQREYLQIERERRNLESQTMTVHEDQAGSTALTVRLTFSDGSVYPEVGRVDFVDVTVDKSTDTVTVRAVVPNPNDTLTDGQLVRVRVQTRAPELKVLVPQAALIADQEGVYVFVVEDGKAIVRRVKTGGPQGPNEIINQGLATGEQVVVEGLQNLRPGTPVLASPVQTTVAGAKPGGA
jgi:membrane fusion protein (multidrug efflux system)